MNTAFLFPGQGSQRPQMLHDLVRHPSVDDTLSEASGILGFDVRTLDSADALQSTVSVQLGLLVVGVATARALLRSGLQPLAVAGLSVGAFAAAVAAEALTFPDAIRLVRSRAEQMEQMYPTGYGLSAIVGLTENHVVRLVNTANSLERPVFVSNINAPKQIVIAGSIEGMKIVLEQALLQGARKAEPLDVSVHPTVLFCSRSPTRCESNYARYPCAIRRQSISRMSTQDRYVSHRELRKTWQIISLTEFDGMMQPALHRSSVVNSFLMCRQAMP
jgi:malonate decarboxylase epsilon subunit